MQGQPVNTTWSCFCSWIAVEYQACPCALFPRKFACLCFWLSAPPAGVCVLVGHTFKLDAEGPSKDVGDLEIRGGILMATVSSAALSSGVLLCFLLFLLCLLNPTFGTILKTSAAEALFSLPGFAKKHCYVEWTRTEYRKHWDVDKINISSPYETQGVFYCAF